MVRGLNMSLDEKIRENRNPGGRRRDSGAGPGPVPCHHRRSFDDGPNRPCPYPNPNPIPSQQTQGYTRPQRFAPMEGPSQSESTAIQRPNPDLGTKLYISNLDCGVSDEDILILFSDIGELKSSAIHYDMFGRSRGTAEVVYGHQADAEEAIRRYRQAVLDGKAMEIQIVGSNFPTSSPPQYSTLDHHPPHNIIIHPIPDPSIEGQRSGNVGNEGRCLTREELDDDLKRYRAETDEVAVQRSR